MKHREGRSRGSGVKDRPNFLIILTDQQRPDSLACYGNVFTHTPNMDRLAAEGARFTNAFTTFPLCTPARASLWSGMYPHACGVVDVVSEIDDAFEGAAPLFAPLKRRGYFQGYFGKWHLGRATPEGMDVWNAFNSGGGQWVDGYQDFQGGTYVPERQTDDMLALLDDLDPENPFLLVQSYYPPHEPYTAPEKYMEMYRGKGVFRPGYYAAVSALDDCIGRLIDRLKATGRYENTVIILTSDHGEHFNYRALHNKSTGHDESLRIPLIVSWPAGIETGQVFDHLVGIHDVLPTVLEIAGIDPPAYLHGRGLWPVLSGGDYEPRTAFYIENVQDFRTIGDWLRIFDMGPYRPDTRNSFSAKKEWDRQRGLRTLDKKIILSEHGDHLMYDLVHDPEEEIDIFGAPKRDYQNQTGRMPDQKPVMIDLITELRRHASAMQDDFGVRLADRVLKEVGAGPD
jgi:arylsulfatase A-like enzyme